MQGVKKMEEIVFDSGIGTEGKRQFTLGAGEAPGALDDTMPQSAQRFNLNPAVEASVARVNRLCSMSNDHDQLSPNW